MPIELIGKKYFTYISHRIRRTETSPHGITAELSTHAGGNSQMTTESKCPVMNGANGVNGTKTARARSNRDWWPNQLNLEILHQNSPLSNPMGEEFDYTEEFKQLDLA